MKPWDGITYKSPGGTLRLDIHTDELPYEFPDRYVGDVEFVNVYLKSLKGCPQEIIGSFTCAINELTTLQYGPTKVSGSYTCARNKLTSLEFAPKDVGGSFFCAGNDIKNLKEEVIKHRIKAKFYDTDEGHFRFDDIKKEFESYVPLDKRVTRSSMRTLLGLDK